MSKERLQEILNWKTVNERETHHLVEVDDFEFLINRAEKAEQYEQTLVYIRGQLKEGGAGCRTKVVMAVDKALEGSSCK